MIKFFTEDVKQPEIKKRVVSKWIHHTIESHGFKEGEISIVFCSDPFLLEYNKKYLSHNYYTDIITFNYNTEKVINGDLLISIDTVKKNSNEFATPFTDELNRVMIHGILHLLGFDDKSVKDQEAMRKLEDLSLKQLYSV